jgi:hypothetical protein
MLARVLAGLVGLVSVLGAVAPAARAAKKPRMVVRDLAARDVAPAEASVVSGAVCRAFGARRRLSVLCGEDLRALLSLASLSASLDGGQGAEGLAKISEALDARFVVSGSLSKVEARYVLALHLLDAEAGAVVGRTAVESTSLDRLEADAEEAAQALLAKL